MNCKSFYNFFRNLFSSLVYVIIKTLTIFILILGVLKLSQFRELVIESACRLKLRNDSVVIETVDGNQELALNQVNSLVISSRQCIISTDLLVALQQFHVNLVLVNKRHQPVDLYQRDRLIDQFNWSDDFKFNLWQLIVKSKMGNQMELAGLSDFEIPETVIDSSEALLAKQYFHKIFGKDFRRDFTTGLVNSALNYGYMILTSRLATEIKSHGYTNVLGIHHHSDNNDLNLACDLVEPFRMIVDNYVVKHQKDQFDRLYRQNLIDLLNLPIIYNSKHYESVVNAMQYYVDDCFAVLSANQNLDRIEVKLCDNETIHHV